MTGVSAMACPQSSAGTTLPSIGCRCRSCSRAKSPGDVDPYGQGWAVTHFFTFDKNRSQQFRQYLAALNAGRSLEDAAKVFGNLNTLDREARAICHQGKLRIPAG